MYNDIVPRYNLDFSKVIDRTQKDLDIYNLKFKLYHEAIKDPNWMYDPAKVLLLEDPTIYMYAIFGVKHRWYQDMIISDNYRFKIFCAANQVCGKSYLLNTGAIYTFLKDHGYGYNRAIISKSLPQSRYQMARIKNILKKTKLDWREDKGDTDNIMVISLNHYEKPGKGKTDKDSRYKYTNYLICAPCTEGALGYDLHEEDLDEFDFYAKVDQEYFYNQIAEPRVFETRGKINIYSNPNGKERYMWELWNQKLPNGKYKWHRYQFNYWDTPKASKEEFELITVGKSKRRIESTLLAIFTSAEGSYFNYDDILKSKDDRLNEYSGVGKQCFGFLDPGSSVDHSAFGMGFIDIDEDGRQVFKEHIMHKYPLGYPMYRVVGIYDPKQDTDGWHHEKSVREYLKEHENPIFDCDVHDNDELSALFRQAGIFPQEIIRFSGPKKFNMYENLNYRLQRRPQLYKRCPSKDFEEQATNLEIKGRAAGGYLMLHASKDSIHDDVIDKSAALCFLATVASIHPGLTVIDSKGRAINSDNKNIKNEVKDIVDKNNEEFIKNTGQRIGNVIQTMDEYMNQRRRMSRW